MRTCWSWQIYYSIWSTGPGVSNIAVHLQSAPNLGWPQLTMYSHPALRLARMTAVWYSACFRVSWDRRMYPARCYYNVPGCFFVVVVIMVNVDCRLYGLQGLIFLLCGLWYKMFMGLCVMEVNVWRNIKGWPTGECKTDPHTGQTWTELLHIRLGIRGPSQFGASLSMGTNCQHIVGFWFILTEHGGLVFLNDQPFRKVNLKTFCITCFLLMPGDPKPFPLRTKALERLAEVLVLISWVEVEHWGLHCRETCD